MPKTRNKRKKVSRAPQKRDTAMIPFLRKLQNFFQVLEIPEAYQVLTTGEKNFLFMLRIQPAYIIIESNTPNNKHQRSIKKHLNSLIHSISDKQYFHYKENKICYSDFMLIGMTLYIYPLNTLVDFVSLFPNAPKIRELMNPFIADNGLQSFERGASFFAQRMGATICNIQYLLNRQNRDFFEMKVKVNLSDFNAEGEMSTKEMSDIRKALGYRVRGAYKTREIATFGESGKRRRAFRMGVNDPEIGINYTEFDLATYYREKENNQVSYSIKAKVYIQSHAIDRLEERLDTLKDYFLHEELHHSVLNAETIIIKPNNHFLIPYYYDSKKLGYLAAELLSHNEESVVLIRTFLFLTCSGTPEFKELELATGSSKQDITALNFDKLSTFTQSDFKDNETVVTLLKQCKLSHLLTISDLHSVSILPAEFIRGDSSEMTQTAKCLSQDVIEYLQLEKEDETVENELG